jgi:hypothetical protein
MQKLFQEFPGLILLNTSCVCAPEEAIVSLVTFYEVYAKYLERAEEYRSPYLALGMSVDAEAFHAMDVGQGRVLLRAKKPLIQMRPVLKGKGLEFSYPQLFAASRDAPTQRVWRNPAFPNSMVFVDLMKWIYRESLLDSPVRIGKKFKELSKREPESLYP